MNYLTKTSLLSARQIDLHSKILEAKVLNDLSLISLLESQLVHRYGISALLELNEKNNELILEEHPSSSFNDSKLLEETQKVSENLNSNSENNSISEIFKQEAYESESNSIDIIEKVYDYEDNKRVLTPPPSPILSHLRRWIPVNDDNLPKAS